MSSNPSQNLKPLYPEVISTNPEATSAFTSSKPISSSSSSSYPTVDMRDVAEKLFPDDSQSPNIQSSEQVLVKIPGAIVHLIEKDNSVELACGELTIVGLHQGDNIVAVLARIGEDIQWPLARDEAAVKLDDAHYFFSLRVPASGNDDDEDDENSVSIKDECVLLNYGLTIASKGQEEKLKELDRILEKYSCFSVQKVKGLGNWEVLDGSVASETSPDELESKEKNDLIRKSSAAYWTTLAPNVDDYSGSVARLIASGSGQLIRGILWCGDVTVDRLKWGNEFLKKRMGPCSNSEISPQALKRVKRFDP